MQKKEIILIIAMVFFISGCSIGLITKESYTFEDGFNELMALDTKYNTDFYTENINTSQWPLEEIDIINQDYIALRDRFNQSASTSRGPLLLLMEYKINNIEATKYFKLKNAIGSRGTVRDGFSCKDKPFVLMAVQYFNTSHQHLLKARYAMDDLLTYYPQSRTVIDIENRRPIIMDPPFAEILRFIDGETRIINKFCPAVSEISTEEEDKEREAATV